MPSRTRIDAWERQNDESEKAYEAFVIYRELGAERSTTKVSERLGKSLALIQRWCRTHKWVDRCRAYDNHLDEKARAEALAKYRKMNARHINTAMHLQEVALEALMALDPKDLHPKYIIQYIKEAAAIEKAARADEAGIKAGSSTAGGGDEGGGTRSLADEIIEAYGRRRAEE